MITHTGTMEDSYVNMSEKKKKGSVCFGKMALMNLNF
jgi:hypothetical protein